MVVLYSNNGVCLFFPDLLALQKSFFCPICKHCPHRIHFVLHHLHTHTSNGTGASVGVTGLEVGADEGVSRAVVEWSQGPDDGMDDGRGDAVGLLDGWMVGMRDAVG